MCEITRFQGKCLCEKVRYRISCTLTHASHCHCSMCRRQHGAAYATYANIDPEKFQWLSGEDLVKNYQLPSGDGWCFCAECGSTLAGTEDGVVTSVTLGTIEGDPKVRAGSHIFVGSKAPWFEITDDLPQFDEYARQDE